MSSKLLRGANVPAEAIAWRRVSSSETVGGESEPGATYLANPGSTSGSRGAAELEHGLLAAERQGFEQGQAAERQSHAAQLEAMQLKLARTIEEVTSARLRYRREAEQDVVALALAVARRILHREMTVAPEALLGLVKAALDKMDAREVHQVRVSRSDAGLLRQFFDQMDLPRRIEVLANPNVAPGGVILESRHGLLDASVDTQLAEIERGFADLVRAAP
jgi:flagellar assembly protein FliH